MDSHSFALALNVLAGQSEALVEAAKDERTNVELVVEEFRRTRDRFDTLMRAALDDTTIEIKEHLPRIRDVSFHVAAARFTVLQRVQRRDSLVQNIKLICLSIDSLLKTYTGVAMITPIFDTIVALGRVAGEAKLVIALGDVDPPRIHHDGSGPSRVFSSLRVEGQLPGTAPPPVSPEHRVEFTGRPAKQVSESPASSAPPSVPEQYRIEQIRPGGPRPGGKK